MKITIIVFSPSGHTLKVSRELEKRFIDRGATVQLLNITGKMKEMRIKGVNSFLDEHVQPHDVLFIGSPVYAGHFESSCLKIIKNLPSVDRKWAKAVVPFVSYGGIHSSVALRDAGNALRKRGRINIFGFKIRCFHSLTKTLPSSLHVGKPDDIDLNILDKVVQRLSTMDLFSVKDVRKSFSYAGKKERLIFSLLSQDFFHKKHRINTIDNEKCTACQLCVKKCPVNAISINKEGNVIIEQKRCILCAECFHCCPVGAVTFPYIEKVNERAGGAVPLENPPSQLYPVSSYLPPYSD